MATGIHLVISEMGVKHESRSACRKLGSKTHSPSSGSILSDFCPWGRALISLDDPEKVIAGTAGQVWSLPSERRRNQPLGQHLGAGSGQAPHEDGRGNGCADEGRDLEVGAGLGGGAVVRAPGAGIGVEMDREDYCLATGMPYMSRPMDVAVYGAAAQGGLRPGTHYFISSCPRSRASGPPGGGAGAAWRSLEPKLLLVLEASEYWRCRSSGYFGVAGLFLFSSGGSFLRDSFDLLYALRSCHRRNCASEHITRGDIEVVKYRLSYEGPWERCDRRNGHDGGTGGRCCGGGGGAGGAVGKSRSGGNHRARRCGGGGGGGGRSNCGRGGWDARSVE
jgi:hypothetical protein